MMYHDRRRPQLEVHDILMPPGWNTSFANQIDDLCAPHLGEWEPGRMHIAVHAPFRELVGMLCDLLRLTIPSSAMGLLDPPGSRGVNGHKHDSDALLFYPKTHDVPLTVRDGWWIDVKAGRAVIVPKKFWHAVPINHTDVNRYCIAMLWED